MKIEYPLITLEQGAGLEEKLVKTLKDHCLTVTTAESCTGGLLAGRIVNVPGASDVFERGYVTYSNEAKMEELGVKEETLDQYGAVSKQVAKQMVKGAAKRAKSDLAIAVTGLAGPEGGTEEKPVGLVYIAVRFRGENAVQKCLFRGNRMEVRALTVINAIQIALQVIAQADEN